MPLVAFVDPICESEDEDEEDGEAAKDAAYDYGVLDKVLLIMRGQRW